MKNKNRQFLSILLVWTTIQASSVSAGVLKATEFGETEAPIEESVRPEYKFLLEVDLTSCGCTEQTETCEIGISKSSLLEVNCPPEHLYCCKGNKKTFSDLKTTIVKALSPSSPDEDSDSGLTGNDPNTKIRLLSASGDDYSLEEDDGDDNEFRSFNTDPIPVFGKRLLEKTCVCKLRESCPEEYRDYGFGFYCTHATIRCCEPTKSPLNYNDDLNQDDNNEEEKPVSEDIPFITPTEEELLPTDRFGIDTKCYCLPRENCGKDADNLIQWRRQDTLCPADLVQCCGLQRQDITDDKTRDDIDQEEAYHISKKSSDIGLEEAYNQPIQLPQLKIPLTEEVIDDQTELAHLRTTLAPPQLPTYYNYQSPKYYSGYYYPGYYEPLKEDAHPYAPDPQPVNHHDIEFENTPPTGSVHYPWTEEQESLNEFHSSQGMHPNPNLQPAQEQPAFDLDRPRSSPNPSLLDKLAQLIG